MAGFRPGFGRGGITHSLLSSDVVMPGLPAGGEAAAIEDGFRVSDGLRCVASSFLIIGVGFAFNGGGFVFSVEDIVGWSRESCSSPEERSDR